MIIMQESCQQSERDCRDPNLYEDLSHLIKIFKTILSCSQNITSLLVKEEECSSFIKHLKDTVHQSEQSIHHFQYESSQQSPHKNTYFRFICRLIQNLEGYKNMSLRIHPASAVFIQFLNRVQNLINTYKLDKNIRRVFQRVLNITNKFCKSCEILANQGTHEEALECLATRESRQGNSERELQLRKNTLNSSVSHFHKVMGELARGFAMINCLDLDYNSFKSSFFEGKNQKKELMKQMLQRNRYIQSQIGIYSKQFEDYLKRRQMQISRKNRFKLSKGFVKTCSVGFKTIAHFNKGNDFSKISQKEEQQTTSYNDKLQKLSDNPFSPHRQIKSNDMSDQKQFEFQTRKTSYQIKNIYLTLNKIHSTTQSNQPYMKTVQKFDNEKNKFYTTSKSYKYESKSSKFADPQKAHLNGSLLQTIHLDFKNVKPKREQSFSFKQKSHRFKELIKRGSETMVLQKIDRKCILQKKNIRIAHILKKESLNLRIRDEKTFNGFEKIHIKGQNLHERQLLL